MTYPPPRTKAGEQYIAAIIRAEGFEGSAPEGLARKAILAIEAEARAGLDVERLARAYHAARIRYPDGTYYCGSESGPFEFDSGPCSCRMDMQEVAAAYGGQREEGRLRERLLRLIDVEMDRLWRISREGEKSGLWGAGAGSVGSLVDMTNVAGGLDALRQDVEREMQASSTREEQARAALREPGEGSGG